MHSPASAWWPPARLMAEISRVTRPRAIYRRRSSASPAETMMKSSSQGGHCPPLARKRRGEGQKRFWLIMSTVLVVEDSPVAREVVMKILQREGYEVFGACNGVEALNFLHVQTPDLVLLDVMMPEKDGM